MKIFDLSGAAAGEHDLPGFGRVTLVTSDNNQRHEPMIPLQGFVMHWTGLDITPASPAAAIRMIVFAAYAWGIVDNGLEAAIIRTLKPTEKGAHLWGRNTGLTGAAYAATADSSRPGYGPGAPTAHQRAAMAVLGGEFCAWHRLDPRGTNQLSRKQRVGKGTVDDRLVTLPGTIAFPVVACHQTYAGPDQYGDERWDTGALCDPDREAIAQVYAQLKAKTRSFALAALL